MSVSNIRDSSKRSPFVEFMLVGLGQGGREFHKCAEDDKINLVPEPDNEFDPNAIKVYVGDTHIGYISKENTEIVHRFLRRSGHILEFYLIDNYIRSSKWLIIDITLINKRIPKVVV
jgi:hypothetical protein